MKHTPGPWTYYAARNSVHHLHNNEPLNELTNGICQMVPNRNPETIANARLIAAAPELLGAGKMATRWLGKMIADNGHLASVSPSDCVKTLRLLEKAIAAAEGGE